MSANFDTPTTAQATPCGGGHRFRRGYQTKGNPLNHHEAFAQMLSEADLGVIRRIASKDNGGIIYEISSSVQKNSDFTSEWEFDSTGKLIRISQ